MLVAPQQELIDSLLLDVVDVFSGDPVVLPAPNILTRPHQDAPPSKRLMVLVENNIQRMGCPMEKHMNEGVCLGGDVVAAAVVQKSHSTPRSSPW